MEQGINGLEREGETMHERLRRYKALPVGLLAALVAGLSLLAACAGGQEAAARRTTGGDPQLGIAAIREHGCYSCHAIPGVRGADGVVGPPLTDWASRWYIAGKFPNEAETLITWITIPQEMDPGVVMPNMGVTPDEARDIATYLYTLLGERPPASTVRGFTIANTEGLRASERQDVPGHAY